jgi:hypothetical protein
MNDLIYWLCFCGGVAIVVIALATWLFWFVDLIGCGDD